MPSETSSPKWEEFAKELAPSSSYANLSSSVLFSSTEISANSTMVTSDFSMSDDSPLAKRFRTTDPPPNSPTSDGYYCSESYDGDAEELICSVCGADLLNSAFDLSTGDEDEDQVEDVEMTAEMISKMSVKPAICTPCKKQLKEPSQESVSLKKELM